MHPHQIDGKFYPLLAAWALLATVPGLYITLGGGGHFGTDTPIGGVALIAWIGGWLAQFAVFFWLMSLVRKQNMLWWFVSAGGTWAVDWLTPVSPILLVACPLAIVATAVWIGVAQHDYESLEEHGVHAKGVVLQVYQPMMNVVINGVYIKRKLHLRIERSDGAAAYEADYNGLFMIGDIPSVGDGIPLLVDSANPQHFQYDDTSADA